MENIADKPLYALEEQLARQKAILANRILVLKLPDKGAKVQDSVLKLEAEINQRKKVAVKASNVPVKDVENIEWTLLGPSGSALQKTAQSSLTELDSDDDEVNCDEEERTLEIVATSQISQRQTKPVFENNCDNSVGAEGSPDDGKGQQSDTGCQNVKLDKYVARLVNVDSKKPIKDKYVPSKTLRRKSEESELPSTASASSSKQSSRSSTPTKSKSDAKYAECLLPSKHKLGPVKLLKLDEGIAISEEKYKTEEEALAAAKSAPRKKYAYDKLKEEGLLRTFSVEMQVSRPVRTDVDEDDEDDLSEDEITEDSDSEANDDDTEKTKTNQKTSKDLSNILNASLKLT